MAWDLAGNARDEIRRARLLAAVGENRAAASCCRPSRLAPMLLDEGWSGRVRLDGSVGRSVSRFRGPVSLLSGRASTTPSPAPARGIPRRRVSAATPGSSRDRGPERKTAPGERSAPRPAHPFGLVSGARSGARLLGRRRDSPGLPGVIIGQNARIAWGLTSVEPDVQDLFHLRTRPAPWIGEWRPFTPRGSALTARRTCSLSALLRHGPIVTDVFGGSSELGRPVALRWTGLDPVIPPPRLSSESTGLPTGRNSGVRPASQGAGTKPRLRGRRRPHRLRHVRGDPDPAAFRRPAPRFREGTTTGPGTSRSTALPRVSIRSAATSRRRTTAWSRNVIPGRSRRTGRSPTAPTASRGESSPRRRSTSSRCARSSSTGTPSRRTTCSPCCSTPSPPTPLLATPSGG